MGKTVTIAEVASSLTERLDIPLPDGESSSEFRLSFARTLRIKHLKETLLRKAVDGVLKVRIPDGGYLPEGSEITESSQVDIAEAQAALEANGEEFVAESKAVAPVRTPENCEQSAVVNESPEQYRQRLLIRHRELKQFGNKAPTKTLAEEEGITDSRVRALLRAAKNNETKKAKGSFGLLGQLTAVNHKKR